MSDEPIIGILNGINDRVGRLLDGQAESKARQVTLERIVLALQEGQISLQRDVTTLRTDVTTLRVDVTTLRTDVTTLQRDVTTLRTDLTTLRVDLMERMDRLGDQIISIREDITVNMGAVDSVRMANEGTKAELRALGEMVFTMHRQMRRLQTQVEELSGRPPAP